jgi:hypothetical protein
VVSSNLQAQRQGRPGMVVLKGAGIGYRQQSNS